MSFCKYAFGVLFGIVLLAGVASGQTATEPVNPGASNAPTGQGGSADKLYNVDLYTGSLGVGLPLYSYSVDGLNLDVNLSYDARGIRVDQAASSVGLGWDIQAGGSITRNVVEVDDNGIWQKKQCNPYNGNCHTEDVLGYSNCGTGTRREAGGPDTYTAIGPFGTFRFQLTACVNGGVGIQKLAPARDIRIDIYNLSDGSLRPSTSTESTIFKVTDEQGNVYHFRIGEYEEKLNDNRDTGFFNHTFYQYPVTKWVLYKIVTRYGQVIRYNYDFYTAANVPVYRDVTVTEKAYYNSSNWGGIEVRDEIVSWTGTLSHLRSIDFPNNTQVLFNNTVGLASMRCDCYNNAVLNDVVIKNKSRGNFIKYRFNYAYFNTPTASTGNRSLAEIPYGTSCADIRTFLGYPAGTDSAGDRHMTYGLRLKLLSVVRVGTDNASTEPYYRFEYNSTPLPYRVVSPSQDFYGYYNGKLPVAPASPNSCLTSFFPRLQGLPIPRHRSLPFKASHLLCSADSIDYGVDRSDDINYAKACVLQKVTNALGGSMTFAYDRHVLANARVDFHKYQASDTYPADLPDMNLVDGLRIGSISLNDGLTTANDKRIEYHYAGGERYYRGGYWSQPNLHTDPKRQLDCKNYFINPMPLPNGSNHGYTEVTVKTFGASQQLQQVKYGFSGLENFLKPGESNLVIQPMPFSLYRIVAPYSFDQQRLGLPLSVTTYNADGTYVTATVENQYEELATAGSNTGDYATPNYVYFGNTYHNPPYNTLLSRAFPVKMVRLKRRTATEYLDGIVNSATTITDYTYFAGNLAYRLASSVSTDSRNRTNGVWYTYDFGDPNGLSRYKVVNGVTLVASCDYRIGRDRKFRLYTDHLLTPAEYGSNVMACSAVKEYYTVTKKDDAGNALEVTDSIAHSWDAAVWDTGQGVKIAAVANARYDEIAYTSFEANYQPSGTPDYNRGNWDFNSSYISEPPYANGYFAVTGRRQFELRPLPNSVITSEVRLKTGKNYTLSFWATALPLVRNGNQTIPMTVKATVNGFNLYECETTGTGAAVIIRLGSTGTLIRLDELRLYPSAASMTTTAYEPLFGPASACDARSNILRYEYDVFGRLKTTRNLYGQLRSVIHTTNAGADTSY